MSRRIKLPDLIPDPRNHNKHTQAGMALLEHSVEQVGVIESITVSSDDEIISGNARHEVMGRKMEGVEPIVIDTDGTRPVILRRTDIKSKTAAFYKASMLANTTAQKNIDIDQSVVMEIAAEYNFTPQDVGVIIVPDKTIAEEDDFKISTEIKTKIVPGDHFLIGNHTLICGDATDPAVWEKLQIGPKTICFTSPPYNAGKSAQLTGNIAMAKKGSMYQGENDDRPADLYSHLLQTALTHALEHCDGVAVNVQPLAGNKTTLIQWIAQNRDRLVDILTWDKTHGAPAMAAGVLNSQFEWIVVFSAKSNSRKIPLSKWRGTLSNVYTAPPQRNNEFAGIHAATFPVHLPTFVARDLMDGCKDVVDCFMGTGTTMVAAHKIGKTALGIELDPKYCQVIINRMLALDPSLKIKRNGKVWNHETK